MNARACEINRLDEGVNCTSILPPELNGGLDFCRWPGLQVLHRAFVVYCAWGWYNVSSDGTDQS
jgi:hypothetical protein